jgi:molecular chaperone HtpG
VRIPETPKDVKQLDLMKLLDAYADGKASWFSDGSAIGPDMQQACRTLHTNLTDLVNQVFAFVLDRVNAREMDMFTMHDRRHGMKVAHLMWHIMAPERRKFLSPPEIGLLVLSAYLHDAGMALTRAEREGRLATDSDLWLNLENAEETKQAFLKLQSRLKDPDITGGPRKRIEQELQQAEEALLTTDTRQRHATPERYRELLELLAAFHSADQVRVPDIERAMSFDGDSFKVKLVDVCMSHNESAEALVESDRENFQLRRFPRVYPVGQANADLQLVAAALRLADILDFDRERTPPLLFHYLLPGGLSVGESISKLEWSKHLAISNWEINEADIVFRGRCTSHIVHHAIVQFCKQIEFEISSTHASFTALEEQGTWPFILPKTVKTQIHEEGYHYVPYSFELDDGRIYRLLMGGAIYDDPLVAVRETHSKRR